jgi:LysR family hca operon transcriptional activator
MKKIGFLSFGHWTPSPQSQARSAADVLLQSIDLSQSRMFPLLSIIDNYLKRSRINITPAHEADHVTMGVSLIMSTRGAGLLPAYAQNFLPTSVTSCPLKGDAPTVDLVLGYRKSNQSPILKLLLSRLDELVVRVSSKTR